MSLAEPPAIKRLPQPRQKWYQLFPENWVQLAFDRDWRTVRMKDLDVNAGTRRWGYWGLAGCTFFILMLVIIGGLSGSSEGHDMRSRMLTLTLFANALFMFVYQSVIFLKTEIEKILLEIIHRLDTEDAEHV